MPPGKTAPLEQAWKPAVRWMGEGLTQHTHAEWMSSSEWTSERLASVSDGWIKSQEKGGSILGQDTRSGFLSPARQIMSSGFDKRAEV